MSLKTNYPLAMNQDYEGRIEMTWEGNVPMYRAVVHHEATFLHPDVATAFIQNSAVRVLPIYETTEKDEA